MFGKANPYGDFSSTHRENPHTRLPAGGGRGCVSSFALGCGATLAMLVFCSGGALWLWPSFVRYGVDSDLARVERLIGSAEIPAEERDDLLEQVAQLRLAARGKKIEFVEWMSLNDQLDALAADERIDESEVPALRRELERLRADLEGH
ncbi:MAG: hypothetical protein KF708_05840 [Pirellulales bacterium]|nr:hypothetical protein [Pirellulales bacterium]